MALAQSHRIIWLDAFIGQDNECHSFKRMFVTTVEPDARYGDPLDILICALNENAAPFIFVDTYEKAIAEIEFHTDKKIIFISSGSLGQRIIPIINSKYSHVYSFYIFCALMVNYVEFAFEYRTCLQMFISELDLLVRLVRDISSEIINQGKRHLELYDPEVALDYFQRSRTLEETANRKDQLNSAFLDNLRLLDDYRDDIGLIAKALIMRNEQQGERPEEQEPIVLGSESSGVQEELVQQNPDSPLAQQEEAQEDSGFPSAERGEQ